MTTTEQLMWGPVTAGKLTARAVYRSDTADFKVTVTHDDGRELSRSVPCYHEPIFGVDVEDMDAIRDAAEALSVQLETNARS